MRKLFFLLVLVIFVSGCASSGLDNFFKNLPGIKNLGSGGGKSFVGGKDSLTLKIFQPSEGGKVSRDVPLVVNVNLKNDGEAPAEGMLCVTGLSPPAFQEAKPCECQEFSLKGKARYNDETAEGEQKTFTVEEGTATLDEFTINDFSVTSIARYSYKTYASVEACVRADMLNSKDCKPGQDAKILGVSSAPLQVTSVSQELLQTSEGEYTLSLFIDVVHGGKGSFFDPSFSKDACSDEIANINKRVDVKIYNAPGGSGTASCTPVVMKKGEEKGTARCTVSGVAARDFNPSLTIELSYTYEVRESNRFEVL